MPKEVSYIHISFPCRPERRLHMWRWLSQSDFVLTYLTRTFLFRICTLRQWFSVRALFGPEAHQVREVRGLELLYVISCHLAGLQCQWFQILEWPQMLQTSACDPRVWHVQGYQLSESCIIHVKIEEKISKLLTDNRSQKLNNYLSIIMSSYLFKYQILTPSFCLSSGCSEIDSRVSRM